MRRSLWLLLASAVCCSSAGTPGGSEVTPAPADPGCEIFCGQSDGSFSANLRSFRTGNPIDQKWSAPKDDYLNLFASAVDEAVVQGAAVPGYREVFVAVGLARPWMLPVASAGTIPLGSLVVDRERADGTHAALANVFDLNPAYPVNRISDVSIAGVNAELHICATTAGGGLWHSIRHNGTTGGEIESSLYDSFGDVELTSAGERGSFRRVGCASVDDPAAPGSQQLHLCGVTTDGHLWHTIRFATEWQSFADVEAAAGQVGDIIAVDCAGDRQLLHVVAVTADGNVWHTTRNPNAWIPFENVKVAANPSGQALLPWLEGFADVAVGICNDGATPTGPHDVSHLNVLLLTRATNASMPGRQVFHTIRSSNPVQWKPLSSATYWKRAVEFDQMVAYSGNGTRKWSYMTVSPRPFAP